MLSSMDTQISNNYALVTKMDSYIHLPDLEEMQRDFTNELWKVKRKEFNWWKLKLLNNRKFI